MTLKNTQKNSLEVFFNQYDERSRIDLKSLDLQNHFCNPLLAKIFKLVKRYLEGDGDFIQGRKGENLIVYIYICCHFVSASGWFEIQKLKT